MTWSNGDSKGAQDQANNERQQDGREEEHWEESEQEVSFLIALLIRYPEIGAVRVLAEEASLRLTFLLNEKPEEEEVEQFRTQASTALSALSRLDSVQTRQLSVEVVTHRLLSTLDLTRDLATLTAEEFPLLLGIVGEAFGNLLVVDGGRDGEVAPEIVEELSLDNSLKDLKGSIPKKRLVGFRDDGRVLVFNER